MAKTDNGNDELSIHIGDLLDLLGVVFLGLRAFDSLLQILAYLVFTDLVCKRAFFGIDGAYIGEVLLQAD